MEAYFKLLDTRGGRGRLFVNFFVDSTIHGRSAESLFFHNNIISFHFIFYLHELPLIFSKFMLINKNSPFVSLQMLKSNIPNLHMPCPTRMSMSSLCCPFTSMAICSLRLCCHPLYHCNKSSPLKCFPNYCK